MAILNEDHRFMRSLILELEEHGRNLLSKNETDLSELRATRVNKFRLEHQLTQPNEDVSDFIYLAKTNNDQYPLLRLKYNYDEPPTACVYICLQMGDYDRVSHLGLRFETGEMHTSAELERTFSHGYPHAQLTNSPTFRYEPVEDDVDLVPHDFDSYPAFIGAAHQPGDMLLSALLSVYGVHDLLESIKDFRLRRTVLDKLGTWLPPHIAEHLPPE